MNLAPRFSSEHRRWLSLLWSVAVVLVFASTQAVIANPSQDDLIIVVGKLKSTNIKYEGVGKATGTQYKGTARIKVIDVLRDDRPQKNSLAKSQELVLLVEQQHRKPTWELQKGRSFIFVLEAIPGTGQFWVRDVGDSDDARVRRIKESGQASPEELQNILHPPEK